MSRQLHAETYPGRREGAQDTSACRWPSGKAPGCNPAGGESLAGSIPALHTATALTAATVIATTMAAMVVVAILLP